MKIVITSFCLLLPVLAAADLNGELIAPPAETEVPSRAEEIETIRNGERRLFEARHRSLLLRKLKLPPSTPVEFEINEHLERYVSVNYGQYLCFALHEDGSNFNCKKRDGGGLSTGHLSGSQSEIVSHPDVHGPNRAPSLPAPSECQRPKFQF